MRTDEEIDIIMNKVRPPFRYVFENLRPQQPELTKEEWESWVIRNPRISGTMIEGTDFKKSNISDNYIDNR